MEPKDRLRVARLAAELSVEQLAARVGVAVTTVRAHENGQNGISAKAARAYSKALGVGLESLVGDPNVGSAVVATDWVWFDIYGSLQEWTWRDADEEKQRPAPERSAVRLPQALFREAERAYVTNDDFVCYSARSIVLTRAVKRSQLAMGDHVVVRLTKGSFYKLTVLEVSDHTEQLAFKSLLPGESASLRPLDEISPGPAEILGVVVGAIRMGRASDRGRVSYD